MLVQFSARLEEERTTVIKRTTAADDSLSGVQSTVSHQHLASSDRLEGPDWLDIVFHNIFGSLSYPIAWPGALECLAYIE